MTKQLYKKLPALLLTLMVGLIATSTAFGAATIVIENVDAAGVGFNDPTPVSPVGSNSGTTLGQQRLNAFQFAANIWGATLTSGPTITIRASWAPLTCTASSGTLGSAGNSGSIWRDFPGSVPGTWYGNALANALSNTDRNGATHEINAQFNINLGTSGCLQSLHWYYGLDTNTDFNGINLVTVLLHEFAHGLGFQTFTNSSTGVQISGFPSIYDRFLFDNSASKTWPQMTNAERVASAINTNNLVWNGLQVTNDATVLSAGNDSAGHPRVYTPSSLQGGSSVSHWDISATPNQLMEPNINAGLSHSVTSPDLTFSLLKDIGWCSGCPQPTPTPTPSPPANNNFANGQIISGCSGSVNGTNLGANKETGEPSHSPDNDPGGGSVWYQWQAPSTGSVTMTTAGSNYDTLLAVYTGNGVSTLTAIDKNDDVDPGNVTTSTLTFNVTANTVYKIAVDGWGNARGNIVLNWNLSGCTPPKTDQTITFPALADKTFGDAPFTISATATSGLPVSFIIVSGPATISGNTVTITGAGTITVRASQSGNATFNAATPVDRSFIAKANQTITFNALADKSFGDAAFNVSATSSSGLPVSFSIVSGPATISGNTISITGVGVVTVRASQAGNANFNAATSVDRTFMVAKANQTITFNALGGKSFGDAPFNVSASSTSGLTVSFSIVSGPATISGNTVTITGAGTITVRASQSGNATFNAATPVDRSFIAKANQTITFNALADKSFGDAPFTISATATSGLPASFSIVSGPATISGNTISITGVGVVTVRASQAGDANFNAATSVDRTFTVAKANQTITFNAIANKIFGDAPFNVSASSTSGLPVSFSIVSGPATISGNTISITGVGVVTVRASQAGNANFNAATSVDRTVTVAKTIQTITFNALGDKSFGDAAFDVSATASSGLPVSFSIVSGPATVSGNTITITGVGVVTVRASQAGNANVNAATPVDRTFTVARANQTITFDALADKSFGDAAFNVSATSSSGLPVSFSIVSGLATNSGNTITITGVGVVTVRASQAGDANFNAATSVDRTFMVAKANQTITFNSLSGKTYGDAPFIVSAGASSSLPVSFSILSGPASVSGNTVTLTGVGTVTVRASLPGDANYNAATPVDQSFTVNKANQTITFNALANKTLGDAPFNVSASSSSGLPITFSIVSGPATNTGNTISITGVGVVTVRASQAGDANFNAATSADRTFTVEAGNFQAVVLTVDQVEIKTWIFQGRTYAYLKFSFPDAGYRVADWGQAVRAGNDFSADAAVEKFTGASVQAVTTTAQIYDLGPLVDGNYTFTLKNSGTVVKSQAFTVAAPPFPANSIDAAREFVKQQYRDFLNREADPAGEDFWTDNITKCSDPARRPPGQTEAQCTLRQRETTSGAFFLSPEFQYTGYYVYRMYQGALGRQPKLSEFTPDAQFVGAGILVNGQLSGAKINQNKADFAQQFVNCTDPAKYRCGEFKVIYDGLNNQQYVDKLFLTTGVNASASDRTALVNGLNGGTETRASVLQKVVDGIVVIAEGNQQFTTSYGQAFYNSESNRAFVQLEYFGYMKRDPDDAGYAFWLGKLDQFGGNFVNAEMVLAFISSPEYRARFGQP